MARHEVKVDSQNGAALDDVPFRLDRAVEHVRYEQPGLGAVRDRARVPRPVDALTANGLPNMARAVEHEHAAGLRCGGLPVG